MQKPLPVRWLIIQGLTENEHCGIQAYACNTESQEDLYAEVPLVGRLTGIEEVKVEAIAGNDSNLLIVFYVQIMPDDFVMQLHRF
ncbi:hypothetical protein BCD20_17470 [Escherichia coli]|nr:hypothetical protein BCD20_17470 [Escherichia coli]